MFDLLKFLGFLNNHAGFTYVLVNSEGEAKQVARVSGRTMIATFDPYPNVGYVQAYLYADKDKKKKDIEEFLEALQKELGTGVHVKTF